jgi:phage major head subunit gpT-like protein
MSRANIPALLELGVRETYFNEYDLYGDQYKRFYVTKDSKKRTETDVMLAGLSTFQPKVEGVSPFFDAGTQAWTKAYTAVTWALGLEITEEGIEDDLYGYYERMGGELGIAAAYTREVEAMDLFNNLTATVYSAGGSNFTLLSTSQFRADGGAWSNQLSGGADLSIESLETLLTQWRTGMLDQRGRKMNEPPATLLVGPSDEWIAHRIVMTDKRPESQLNDVNVVKARRNLTVEVSDFMTDDGRWFLLARKERTGLRYNDRRPNTMRRRDDPRTGNMLMVASYRESHGASPVYGIMGSST